MRSFDTWWIFGAIVQTASHVSGFDRVAEPRAKADRAQNAELVFFEPRVGIADGANYLGGNVLLASNVIDDFLRCGIVQQPVNREIPPQHILAGVCEDHPGGPAAIHIRFAGIRFHSRYDSWSSSDLIIADASMVINHPSGTLQCRLSLRVTIG